MKKLVRVSLFVLMALTLSLAIGCKNDSDPGPAKEGSRTPFVGTWVDGSGIICTINADGTFVTEADKKYEGKYHVSPDGKTVTATTTVDGNEETFTLTLKAEDTLELTLPASWGGEKKTLTKKENADSDPEQKPTSANFAGEWKSTDGSATATLKDGNFTTVMSGQKLEGTYTVDGNTATTSKVQLPAEMSGGKDVSASFPMKMVDGNDVMELTVPTEVTQGEPFYMTFVKVSTTTSDLTGTWKGKVVAAGNADATIVFADNEANLTLAGQTVTSTNVSQNGNFFTITWGDNPLKLSESTGLISDSGKAWLDDGSVFTK